MPEDNAVLKREERRAAEAVDADRLFALLADLIAIESVANRETPAQERVAEELRAIGLETDVWEIDFERLRRHPAYTADVERHEGLGVVGSMGRGEGRTLILNGHVDVVPAGEVERWTHPPFELTKRDGRLFGRGVVDMKGQVCGALAAARALRDAGIELDGALQIQSVIGEEDGGSGTLATIERGHTGDGAIVVEPTEFVIAPAQAGALSFRLTVPGLAAHGAMREEGVDPVEKFIPIFQRLRALEADRNRDVADPLFRGEALPYALTMGRLRAGIWPSTVAESLVIEGRYGVAPGEDLAGAQRALEDAVAEAASGDAWLRDHPPTSSGSGRSSPPPARTRATPWSAPWPAPCGHSAARNPASGACATARTCGSSSTTATCPPCSSAPATSARPTAPTRASAPPTSSNSPASSPSPPSASAASGAEPESMAPPTVSRGRGPSAHALHSDSHN